jgi:histidyl-tRNA synthetase
LKPIVLLEGSNEEKLAALKSILANSSVGLKGIAEIEEVFDYIAKLSGDTALLSRIVDLDITLARGLNYYTGCIFEVKTNEVAMGSIGGGGRYDDLTGMFGLKDLTGVGVSFGADRIYDVLEELNLFPANKADSTKLLIINFDKQLETYTLGLLNKLRKENIAVELYAAPVKLKKQMGYADGKGIPYVLLVGEEEVSSGQLSLKDMESGEQVKVTENELIQKLR